jgi:alpha-L-fucosidase
MHNMKTQNNRNKNIKWWKNAQFGIIIHWGLYSILGGVYKNKRPKANHEGYRYAEWIMATANIPHSEYQKLANRFNPKNFNARDWVDTVVASGAKYLVITAKHHEGFSMYNSKICPYNIVAGTPYRRDIMKELALECKRAKLPFGIYYSILDWSHPAQLLNKKKKNPEAKHFHGLIKKDKKKEYVSYMKSQLKELILQYDPAILFFDGDWVEWWTKQDGQRLTKYLRELKPTILLNNRVGKREPNDGDFGTPEQEVPLERLGYPWETCMTMNGSWGYSKLDKDWKSASELYKTLCDVKSKGGNFLLNIGPSGSGEIPKASVVRLKKLGELIKRK